MSFVTYLFTTYIEREDGVGGGGEAITPPFLKKNVVPKPSTIDGDMSRRAYDFVDMALVSRHRATR